MKTAVSTTVIPISAPVIWPIAFRVASFGGRPSSLMMRSTFSTTTMASSTRMPIASTMPNMVSTLIENPKAAIRPQVPNSATGTTSVGISVARKFCRKRYITRKTRMIASTSVLSTSSTEIFTKVEVSSG